MSQSWAQCSSRLKDLEKLGSDLREINGPDPRTRKGGTRKRLGHELSLKLPNPHCTEWREPFSALVLTPSEHSTNSVLGFIFLFMSQFYHCLIALNKLQKGVILCVLVYTSKTRIIVNKKSGLNGIHILQRVICQQHTSAQHCFCLGCCCITISFAKNSQLPKHGPCPFFLNLQPLNRGWSIVSKQSSESSFQWWT